MSDDQGFVYRFGGHQAERRVATGTMFEVFTEDCFSGKLSSTTGKPREVAPFPHVNPLTGPIHVEGVKPGDILAIHVAAMEPARDWGVATVSPDFGLLSGTRSAPNLQPPADERVWIWRFDEAGTALSTEAANGVPLTVPYRPFFGTIGVAPAHGEVRLSVVPGDFGGNMDIPDLGPGATLYLRANVDGAHLHVGDGHYAQGDGEIAGTAIEGAFRSRLALATAAGDDSFDWPRIETDSHIGVVGVGRPLDSAIRVAAAGLVRWVASLAGLHEADAHQLVTQAGTLRIGNMVNPEFTALFSIAKAVLPSDSAIMGGCHDTLRMLR